MNVTEPIINAALLGTAAKEFIPSGFPLPLEETFRHIQEKSTDPESALYQIGALAFAYHRAGTRPLTGTQTTPIKEAPEDTTPYFDREAGELLTHLHANRNRYLLLYAYRKAIACKKLIPPYYQQTLISRAFDRTNPDKHEEQALLSILTGNRGRWLLCQMELPDWGNNEKETWETASHEERKRMLRQIRKENPEQGIALLQTELKNESAAHRNELIQCLQINLCKTDESFLQDIASTDRSNNVKETARTLLSRIPDSEWVKTYCNLLRGKLHYNMFLGWSYDTIDFTPEMKQLGLEEISPNKKEKDKEYLLRQLAERVPLHFWCEFYNCHPEKAANKLAKRPPFNTYFNISKPIENFNDNLWAYHTLKEYADPARILSLVGLLTAEQREEITLGRNNKEFHSVPETWFNADGKTWGMKFSIQVLNKLLQSKYYYNPTETAERLACYLPAEIACWLEQQAAVPDTHSNIANFCRSITEYIKQKERINILFNDIQ
ncbi:DUF5691 domain-containing protein [Phocaeicola sp.]|uniref:DUF5691 domain-containing protein n=1 Tax=Phocaeicola sp. TaxID=2773926 RepID=UPI0023C8C337|nr:DUF5691 domain-containing protein [Phocaeicola sp.]MDE5676812.1 hypothetical protein [Phocaeicola sp.]